MPLVFIATTHFEWCRVIRHNMAWPQPSLAPPRPQHDHCLAPDCGFSKWIQIDPRVNAVGVIPPRAFSSRDAANEVLLWVYWFCCSPTARTSRHETLLWWRSSEVNWPVPSTEPPHVPVETYNFFHLVQRVLSQVVSFVWVCIDPLVCCYTSIKATALPICALSRAKCRCILKKIRFWQSDKV